MSFQGRHTSGPPTKPDGSWTCNPEGCPFKDIDDAPGDLVPALRNFLSVAIFSAHAEILSKVERLLRGGVP